MKSEDIKRFLFEENWIEAPLYHNNKGKTIRFDLVPKLKKERKKLINQMISDLFPLQEKFFVVFYGTIEFHWREGKKYCKASKLERITEKAFETKLEDPGDEGYHCVVCSIKRKYFNFRRFFRDYLRDDGCQMAFFNQEKTVIQFYDSRGFDVLSNNKEFLKELYKKYEKDVIEYNRLEIIEALGLI